MTAYPPQGNLAAVTSQRSNTCAWCGTVTDGTLLSCPSCGASLDVRANVTKSGWSEVPGRKDMAKLQFGNSTCQIEGLYVPVIDLNLAAGDSVYFAHHVLLWKDNQIKLSTVSLKGAWKRMLSGMPVIMAQAHGPGRIAFSRDAPGEMIALPIQPGQTVDVREHVFVIATGQVSYDWFNTNIWFNTKDDDKTVTHYPLGMVMDRFSAQKMPGLVLVHGSGNVFVRRLAPNESALIKPTSLLFKDSTVQMQLHMELPRGSLGFWSNWNHRNLWLRVTGPGRIAVQSAFEPVEDDGKSITNSSVLTQQRW
jgi:uncharacterized protein (AIM24 family)